MENAFAKIDRSIGTHPAPAPRKMAQENDRTHSVEVAALVVNIRLRIEQALHFAEIAVLRSLAELRLWQHNNRKQKHRLR